MKKSKQVYQGFPYWGEGGGHGRVPSPSYIFFDPPSPPPINHQHWCPPSPPSTLMPPSPHQHWYPSWGTANLIIMKTPSKKHPPTPHWKVKPPYRKWFLEKNPWKIRNCHRSLCFNYKTTLEKDGRNPIRTWLSHLGVQTFERKVKQLVRKYYLTWLITQFVAIDISLLTVWFCNYQLFYNCPFADL